ncbi:hypothetical protein DFH28DRAFT_1140950 [Melampsora americana]|nr:hypothetical protein DFH28DRAFT_1140950 [Melampsora americana]
MTLDLLRLLAEEFKRDSVGDAIMTLRGTSFSVNVYGTLAYRIQDAGTVDATAQVTALEYNWETHGTTGEDWWSNLSLGSNLINDFD